MGVYSLSGTGVEQDRTVDRRDRTADDTGDTLNGERRETQTV